MEEERIKSALEIAMERISALPELTPEEIAAQKEKEYGPIGTAMAVKYMNSTVTESELPIELNRHPADRRPAIRRALVSSLCREMLLVNTRETAIKALKAMSQIAPEKAEFLKRIERDLWEILGEFEAAREEGFCEFEVLANEKFRNLGISGSAVRINMAENEEWRRELNRIQQAYEPRLESLKSTLMKELRSA